MSSIRRDQDGLGNLYSELDLSMNMYRTLGQPECCLWLTCRDKIWAFSGEPDRLSDVASDVRDRSWAFHLVDPIRQSEQRNTPGCATSRRRCFVSRCSHLRDCMECAWVSDCGSARLQCDEGDQARPTDCQRAARGDHVPVGEALDLQPDVTGERPLYYHMPSIAAGSGRSVVRPQPAAARGGGRMYIGQCHLACSRS